MENKPENIEIKVAHIITRMIIGGAQENTLSSVIGLQNKNFNVYLITGIEKGPEGRLNLSEVKNLIFVKTLVRNINPIYDFLCFLKLLLLFKKNKFNIVHTHSSKAGIIGRFAAFFAGVPIIIHTIHGLPFHKYQNIFLNVFYIILEKICSLFTNKIIVVTENMKEKSLEAGISSKDKYITIYSGMDLDDFLRAKELRKEMRKKLGINDEKIVIGKISRFFPLKGHDILLPVCKELIDKYRNVIFLWVGDGILKDEYIAKIKHLNMYDNFIFTGLVDPNDIKNYLSIMDILVHVSLREGLARVIPQAFAAKVPVVSFDVDGAKDVINDSINGYLVPPLNNLELTKKIEILILNENLRIKFADNAINKVDPYFRNEYMVEQIEKVYREFIC